MKNKLIIFSVVFGFFLIGTKAIFAQQCKARNLVVGCKPNLKPYVYDSYAISDIEFNDKPKKVEIQFTAFADQKYKLVFCSSGFDEKVTMNIYDKNDKVKNRQKLYDSDKGIDNLFWSFVPPKSGDYFIEYEIPPSDDNTTKTGCIILLVGTNPLDSK